MVGEAFPEDAEPLLAKVHFWAGVPLQVQMSILLPLVILPPESSRHLPPGPLSGLPVAVTFQLKDAARDVPDGSEAVTVTP